MAYAEESDLSLSAQRLIELTDSDDAVGVKDSLLIDKLHVRATNKVNAAVFGKYNIVGNFPPILTQIESDLWRYYLYAHREVMEIPSTVRDDYKASSALLERYRTGAEALDAPHTSASTAPAATCGSFSSDSDDRLFGRAKDGIG